MHHSRQHETIQDNRNRATGFSDADWGALEKRLSDTRDLLQDILTHLRKVLDNLKTASSQYQSTGRARRGTAYAKDSRSQYGRQRTGPAAGATNSSGTSDTRFQSTTSSSSTTTSGSKQDFRRTAPGAEHKRTTASSHSSSGTYRSTATGQTGQGQGQGQGQNRPGASGFSHRTSESAGRPGADRAQSRSGGSGQPGADQYKSDQYRTERTGQGPSSSRDASGGQRQTGNGFSWGWRGEGQAGQAGASSGASSRTTTSGASSGQASGTASGRQAGASAGSASGPGRDDRAGRSGAWNDRAGSATGGTGPGQRSREQESGRQGFHQERTEERRRTAGSGSSYQDYSKRNNKTPLGHGRMTLTQACALLCLTYPCTADEVKSAYRKQARRHHPDLGGDEEMMKSINQAYELAMSWCSPLRGKTSATWAA